VSGLEFSSAAGHTSVRFCSRHGFVFDQDSACACTRKSSCTSPGSVPISFLGAGCAAGFQVPIHFPALVAPAGFQSPAVLRQVLSSAPLSAQEEAYLQRPVHVGSRRRFLQLVFATCYCPKLHFVLCNFIFPVRVFVGGFLVLFLSRQIKSLKIF
jgi:hypothetical protein